MKVLLHMPHTKLRLPPIFYKWLIVNKNELHQYNLIMSDVGVDELFKGIKAYRIHPKYSRLYCDVEKFKDDNLEVMSKYGQGVVYTHTYNHYHKIRYFSANQLKKTKNTKNTAFGLNIMLSAQDFLKLSAAAQLLLMLMVFLVVNLLNLLHNLVFQKKPLLNQNKKFLR